MGRGELVECGVKGDMATQGVGLSLLSSLSAWPWHPGRTMKRPLTLTLPPGYRGEGMDGGCSAGGFAW